MKTQSSRVVTVRLTPDEIRYLSELSVIRGITRSEVIREMIAKTRHVGIPKDSAMETMLFVACLLSSLVRKMAKTNQEEAEQMIAMARKEARKEAYHVV